MNKNFVEALVGGLFLALVIALMVFMATRGYFVSNDARYTLHANFIKVENVNVGSDVKLSGVNVGNVEEVHLDKETFEVKVVMSLHNDVKVPEDSLVQISKNGLFGASYLEIIPGRKETMVPPEGRIKRTKMAPNLESLISKFMSKPSD